jgi:hypothetical protein
MANATSFNPIVLATVIVVVLLVATSLGCLPYRLISARRQRQERAQLTSSRPSISRPVPVGGKGVNSRRTRREIER